MEDHSSPRVARHGVEKGPADEGWPPSSSPECAGVPWQLLSYCWPVCLIRGWQIGTPARVVLTPYRSRSGECLGGHPLQPGRMDRYGGRSETNGLAACSARASRTSESARRTRAVEGGQPTLRVRSVEDKVGGLAERAQLETTRPPPLGKGGRKRKCLLNGRNPDDMARTLPPILSTRGD